jgi:hypothetical protein
MPYGMTMKKPDKHLKSGSLLMVKRASPYAAMTIKAMTNTLIL